jgi:hypothetical protein
VGEFQTRRSQKMRKVLAVTMGFMLTIMFAAGAGAITVTDTEGFPGAYYGGIAWVIPPGGGPAAPDLTYSHDVVPAPSNGQASDQWRVDTLQATVFSPGFIQVVLTGQYFASASATDFLMSGDLYISSTGWFVANKSADGHAIADTFSQTTEHWDYVVKYTPNAAGFNTAIYAFNQTLPSYIPTGAGTTHLEWRSAQAWRGGYVGNGTPAVSILDPDAQTLTFRFPDLGILDPDKIGYHWTQDCGNDVVEGGQPGISLPEPGILFLLGLGIAGLAVYRRRGH